MTEEHDSRVGQLQKLTATAAQMTVGASIASMLADGNIAEKKAIHDRKKNHCDAEGAEFSPENGVEVLVNA